jgi:O-methyltransferase
MGSVLPGDPVGEQLLEKLGAAIADGAERVALWGVSPLLFRILDRLRCAGAGPLVVGITDHRLVQQGRKFAGHSVCAPDRLADIHPDIVVMTLDRDHERALMELARSVGDHRPVVLVAGSEAYEYNDTLYQQLASQSLARSHAAGYPNMQVHLYQALTYIAQRGLQGDVVEFGVYKAGTLMFLACALERLGHPGRVYGFDTFGGFPQSRSVLDMHSSAADEFRDAVAVRAWTSTCPRVELVEGDICDTYRVLEGRRLVLAFFDTDNYTATRAALPLCYEQTVTGGVLAFDHYYSPGWPSTIGERMAAHEVLAGKPVLNLHGTGIFLKWGT